MLLISGRERGFADIKCVCFLNEEVSRGLALRLAGVKRAAAGGGCHVEYPPLPYPARAGFWEKAREFPP
jgi:hypothetical protein